MGISFPSSITEAAAASGRPHCSGIRDGGWKLIRIPKEDHILNHQIYLLVISQSA